MHQPTPDNRSDSHITAVQSGSAAVRLREARRFLDQLEPGAEVLLLGASRGSVDDLARTISLAAPERRRRDCIDAGEPGLQSQRKDFCHRAGPRSGHEKRPRGRARG